MIYGERAFNSMAKDSELAPLKSRVRFPEGANYWASVKKNILVVPHQLSGCGALFATLWPWGPLQSGQLMPTH
jgi:hypothetical protein